MTSNELIVKDDLLVINDNGCFFLTAGTDEFNSYTVFLHSDQAADLLQFLMDKMQ